MSPADSTRRAESLIRFMLRQADGGDLPAPGAFPLTAELLDLVSPSHVQQLYRACLVKMALEKSNDDPRTPSDLEDDIHIHCALRFDGYRYMDATGFKYLPSLNRALRTQKLPRDKNRRFTLYFVLQRILYKWGGEYIPRNDRHWRLFRSFFLDLAREPIPPEFAYIGHDQYHLRWTRQYTPNLDETIAFIHDLHHATRYRDQE